MAVKCLLVIASALLGLCVGYFGTVAAMLLAGGGHSHNDIFIAFESAVVWMLLGGAFGPEFIRMVASPSGKRVRLYALGMIGSVFGAGTAFYHAVAIARLPVDRGGPISNLDPALREQLAFAVSAALGVLAAVFLVRMVHASHPAE